MPHPLFILASRSPARRAILERLKIPFDVVPSTVDENSVLERDPMKRAVLLAEMKARDVGSRFPDAIVIGADTLVVSEDGELLEKPADEDDARRMLRLQSGHTSTVHSGLCLAHKGTVRSGVSTATVTFKKLSTDVIDAWIQSGLWQGRSGAFQAEQEGEKLIECIEGEEETVVGLPVALFQRLSCPQE